MNETLTLADLTARTGLDVLDHLERQLAIPVLDGFQAQGDLLVVPLRMMGRLLRARREAAWRRVPSGGIELLRGGAGGNAHTLTAEPGTCEWTTFVEDPDYLALGVLRASAPVYLIHPEHGASGIAPGEYAIRRQRERVARWTAPGGFRYEFGADRMIAD